MEETTTFGRLFRSRGHPAFEQDGWAFLISLLRLRGETEDRIALAREEPGNVIGKFQMTGKHVAAMGVLENDPRDGEREILVILLAGCREGMRF